jgi:Prokaryotic ubiquitin-like protein UBact
MAGKLRRAASRDIAVEWLATVAILRRWQVPPSALSLSQERGQCRSRRAKHFQWHTLRPDFILAATFLDARHRNGADVDGRTLIRSTASLLTHVKGADGPLPFEGLALNFFIMPERIQKPTEPAPWGPKQGDGGGPRSPDISRPDTKDLLKKMRKVDPNQSKRYRQRTGQ